MTVFISHPVCLEHGTNPGHPESPGRLKAILEAVQNLEPAALHRQEAAKARIDDLLLAHEQSHIETVFNASPKTGLNFLDGDTVLSPQTLDAALYAAGGVIQAIESVIKGGHVNAFCAMRPPGHHAGKNRAGGSCFFNNVAIGAMAALNRFGLSRVAIVDFDVHHGDGTQGIVWDNPDIFFASLHQSPLYPYTGSADETGAFDNILNIPLAAGSQGKSIIGALRDRVLPRLTSFRPDMIFVSAGFDGHRDDPLGGWDLDEDDYAAMMRLLLDAAKQCCSGKLVTVLEGGYNLEALAASVTACLEEMMKKDRI